MTTSLLLSLQRPKFVNEFSVRKVCLYLLISFFCDSSFGIEPKLVINESDKTYFNKKLYVEAKLEQGVQVSVPNIKDLILKKVGDGTWIGLSEGKQVYDIRELTYSKTKEYFVKLLHEKEALKIDKSKLLQFARERGGVAVHKNVQLKININFENREVWWSGEAKYSTDERMTVIIKVIQNKVFAFYHRTKFTQLF